MDDAHNYLYTRGSVDLYRTYPGMYVPRTLGFGIAEASKPALFLAEEILKLTKTNWNNTQIDTSCPVTWEAAREVGCLPKHVRGLVREQSYRFFM